MLQTSIAAWLNKPKPVKEPAPRPIALSTKLAPIAPRHVAQEQPAARAQPAPSTAQNEAASYNSNSSTTLARPLTNRRPLPPNVTLSPITPDLLPSFRRLNALLLPIPYPPSFYAEVLTDATVASITLAALWHDDPCPPAPPRNHSAPQPSSTPATKPHLVAAIRCRLLLTDRTLYISTLATLSPYRGHGLASALLAEVTARAVREHGVASVSAHVWEANAEALAWYAARGFRVEGREEGYYRRLKPGAAVVVRRAVEVGDLLGVGGGGGGGGGGEGVGEWGG